MEFDIIFYKRNYKLNLDDVSIKRHFVYHGRKKDFVINGKGDKTIKEFNYKFYVTHHPDLSHMTEPQALEHYLIHGLKENRAANYEIFRNRARFTSINKANLDKGKLYMVLSQISYPFGGGECYLLQTMKYAKERGYVTIWISFCDKGKKIYNEEIIEYEEWGVVHKIMGGYTEDKVKYILSLYHPDVVHTQGGEADIISLICRRLRIPVIRGYHFWGGLVDLHEKTGNRNILLNKEKHKISPYYTELKDKNVVSYVASDFMNEVISSLNYQPVKNVIYPLTDPSVFICPPYSEESEKRKYITVVNICKLKGGEIILHLIKETKLPFLLIQTEPNSYELDKKIKKVAEEEKCLYMTTQKEMNSIYEISKMVLIPTLVDETFCRVAYEAAKNGIPLLTTGKGFVSSLINMPELILSEDKDEWVKRVREMYNDKEMLKRISLSLRNSVERFTEEREKEKFLSLVDNCYEKSKERNIMIFTPWCDQGLGIQSRTYAQLLLENGFKVYIFAFLPYSCVDKEYNLQKNPEEWTSYTNIYYSFNTREDVTKREIQQFVNKFNVGKCLIPEICYDHIFTLSSLLSELYVEVYAIPNVEIVRENELEKYNVFHKILSPSHILIEKIKVDCPIVYIGHGVEDRSCEKKVDEIIEFVHISGMNAVQRKQTLKIISAFNLLENRGLSYKLTITIEGNIPEEIYALIGKNIELIDKHLSHDEIFSLYKKSHVSIQVSSHEGLGLGFYESISCSTPIISLNTPPHNEVVIEGETGWLINDITYFPLKDNSEAIIQGADFSPIDLTNKIVELIKNPDEVNDRIRTCREYFCSHFTKEKLSKRLIESIS
jgi:glycosyltransferase involved in cell wall biosynthesis